MTGKQLKKLLEMNGWTQVGMARELEISERTMRVYIATEVPKNIEIAVLCLLNHKEKRK